MSVLTWEDNQAVSILTSHPGITMDNDFDPTANITVSRNVQNRHKIWYKELFFQPCIVAFFVAHMGGVDQLLVWFNILAILSIYSTNKLTSKQFSDQLCKSQHRHMKSRRWQTGSIFSLLLNWSIINSVIIYQSYHPPFQMLLQSWPCSLNWVN